MSIRLSLVAMLAIGTIASASDLPVAYAVQEKPLKASRVGTPLTFTLYSDDACTRQIYQAVVPIENVTLISHLKLFTPKGAVKAPTTDEIRATLPGVNQPAQTYLKVTGAGITPGAGSCQIQVSSKTSAPSAVFKDSKGLVIGPVSTEFYVRANGFSGALYGVAGTVVDVPIQPDGRDFAFGCPEILGACVEFQSNNCSGQPLMRFIGLSSLVLPVLACPLGSVLYYPPSNPLPGSYTIQSQNCGFGCLNANFVDTSVVPAATADLSSFTPPFHLEVQ
jgi:hypothetical protein